MQDGLNVGCLEKMEFICHRDHQRNEHDRFKVKLVDLINQTDFEQT